MNIEKMLREAGAEEGDRIELTSKFGNVRGMLMPRTASTSDDVITIKLDNGYNIGI
ncbi:MAG: Glu-tRNA(Gln) amidotransferase GatDE subunit D, partial [Thermoplasmata archaeon HGW-Thermoplasmata-2]